MGEPTRRARGWRYICVPQSVLRHRHAASLGENSPTFDHYVHRNRLVTLVKNAPAAFVAARCVRRFVDFLDQVVFEESREGAIERPGLSPPMGLVELVGGDELLPGRHVDAVEAGMGGRRAGDAEMHLPRAGRDPRAGGGPAERYSTRRAGR